MNIVSIIIAITVLISFQANKNPDLKQRFLYIPYQIKHNNEYYRLISHIFIHADISHLAFNMISLYFLGSTLSYYFIDYYGLQLGTSYLLILYFAGAIFASLPSFLKQQDNSAYRSLGASGAVSAVIFAAILWDPSMSLGILFIPFPICFYLFLEGFCLILLASELASFSFVLLLLLDNLFLCLEAIKVIIMK